MTIEPVFCQNCGRLCKAVHVGDNNLLYCSRDCEITDRLIVEYESAILLTILALIFAMAFTTQYMADKYSPTTQENDND